MRKEFVYSVMALGAIPITVNAADVKTCDVQASTDGSKVTYPVGKLVPGNYTFSAKLSSKVYGVQVKITGAKKPVDVPSANNPAEPNVTINFDLTEETDVELELVSTDPGEAGAGFTVAEAKVILNFNLAKAKDEWADAIGLLKTKNMKYYEYDSTDDEKAADDLITELNKIEDTYEAYVAQKLYQTASVPQGKIDALAATIADHQNTQAYNNVNAAITAIKAKLGAAKTALTTSFTESVAEYLLANALNELDTEINQKITAATQASYTSYQNGTAVDDETDNTKLIPEEGAEVNPNEGTLNYYVQKWEAEKKKNVDAYNALHKIVTDLQAALDAVKPAEAIASQFATEKQAAQDAIDAVNADIEQGAKNSAAQLTLADNKDFKTKKTTAGEKIETLAGKVTTANAEYNANEATLAAIKTLQDNLNAAKAAVYALKYGDASVESYYTAYVADIQKDINDRTNAAKKAYETDHNAVDYNVNAAPVQAKIDLFAGTTEPAVDGMPKQAVAKYNALQTAIAAYEKDLADARTAAQEIGPDVYTADGYDYQTEFDLIQKRINDIKKAITAAMEKKGAEHWTAMLAIGADADITNGIKTLLAKVQGDQNKYDADFLAGGMTTLEGQIAAFQKKDASKLGADVAAFQAFETDINTAYGIVKAAKDAINANSETVDYTAKVGTDAASWGGSVCPGDNSFAETYGTSAAVAQTGVIMQQTINVENGIYTVELYANANYTSGRGFDSDLVDGATDVAYVFANGKPTSIVAHKDGGMDGSYTIENVVVSDGVLTMGLGKAKAGTNWHTIKIKSLTANTASLIQNWGAKIADLNDQQAALERAADAVATKVDANTKAQSGLATNIDNLQAKVVTFVDTYKIGTDNTTLGNRGKDGGSIDEAVDKIVTDLGTLETANNGVDPTAVTNVDKTDKFGKKKADWPSTLTYGQYENYAENNGTVESYKTTVEGTGIVMSQEVTGLENGIYDVVLTANANYTPGRGFDSDLVDGATDAAYVFANDKKANVVSHVDTGWTLQDIHINGVIVSDGTLKLGIGKYKAQTNWNAIQIKSLTYHENSQDATYNNDDPEALGYNNQYTALAKQEADLEKDAPNVKKAVENNAAANTAAQAALTTLGTYELDNLKQLADVTNDLGNLSTSNSETNNAKKINAKKADPSNWTVFRSGLDADKTYTAKKNAIDATIAELTAAVAAANAAETLPSPWADEITVVTEDDPATPEVNEASSTTYKISEIKADITALKAEAGTESANYWGYRNTSKTYFNVNIDASKYVANADVATLALGTGTLDKEFPQAATDLATIEKTEGAGAEPYYTGLINTYKAERRDIIIKMLASLNGRTAVADNSARVNELKALVNKVKAIKGNADANLKKYTEQKTAYTEAQTLWNNTYTEIAATDQSSKAQDWLDELDAIQVTLTAATNAVEENYKVGESVAKAQDIAAIKAAINDVKAKQAKSYNEFIAADNKAAHESFIGSETTTGAIQLATEAFQRAFDERGKYSSNIQSIQGAINTAAATLDAALYDCPTKIEDLKKKENQKYVEVSEANAALGEGELAAVFDVHQYNADAVKIEQDITKDLQDFKNALGTAIADVWTSDEYAKLVKAANDAIKEAETIYGADATAEAFKDVVAVIAKGEASVVKDPEDDTKVVSVDIEALEDAISALTLIDALLDADMNEAANIDLLAEIAQRDTAKDKETLDGYADVKAFDEAAKKVAKAKEDRATYYEAGTLAYIDDKGDLQGYYGDIMTLLNDYTTAFEKIKKDAKDAKDADEANTKAYNEMIEAIAPVEKKLEDAMAAAAPYKHATSFATDEQNLANIKKAVEDAKKNGGAVNYQTTTFNVATLSTAIETTLTTAFGTEKTGLATDITELKNQYNTYVAKNGLDETATAFKKDIDNLEKALGAAAIKDLDDPVDNIQFDEIVAATEALIKLQNDIAAKQVELLGANGNGNANADVLADFQQQLGDLKETASLEGYDKWVGQQAYDNTTLAAAIADLNGQIADLETAIAAEENISFYQDQYQKQIDAIAEELTKVVGEITKKQAQFTANAEAYEKLTKEINDLQTAINDAKEKVGEYEYAANTYIKDIEEYNNADKPKLIGGVQKTLNDAQKDIEDKNAAKSLTETSVVPNKANIEDAIQLYLDKSANKELIEQKANLNTLLTNAIKPGDKEGKMSSRLWKVLTDEKSDISKEITALWKAIIASNLTYEGSFDVVTEQGVMTDVGVYYYTLDKNNQKIAKVCTSDVDYAAQMEIVQAIQEEIAGLKAAVTNIGYLGDANEDTKVNVLDYQTVVNMILNPELQPEEETILFANTDVNKNDIIEVGDLTAIVNYILTSQWQGGYAAARSMNAEGESIAMNVSPMEQGKQRIAVSLANVSDYTAFQMDMVLPEGMTFVGASLSNRAGESHTLYSRAQKDGSIRVLASSIKGETFSGNEGAVLYIDVEGAGNVELVNILFSDVNAQTHLFTIGGDATGINNVSTFESLKQQVYDFGGRLVKGLKKGMNIIRRNDGSTDKVIVK